MQNTKEGKLIKKETVEITLKDGTTIHAIRHIIDDNDLHYDYLLNLVITLSAYSKLIQSEKDRIDNNIHFVWHFTSNNSDQVLTILYKDFLELINSKKKINSMVIYTTDELKNLKGKYDETFISKNYFNMAISYNYLKFYDKIKKIIERKSGKDPKNWSDILNFARIIRNACAHDGKIQIDGSKSEYKWKYLSYSFKDNGKEILLSDITPVEIFFLMEEINNELK